VSKSRDPSAKRSLGSKGRGRGPDASSESGSSRDSAGRVFLRAPTLDDRKEFLNLVSASRRLHHPWVTPPATPAQFRTYVERMSEPGNVGFLVCVRPSGRIVGVINVSNIVMGVFRSAYLGYYAFAGGERRGYMRSGLEAAIRHAFRKLKLHRLEANIQPGNVASLALVRSLGFAQEGYSPRYLKIGGRWRDHERWAVLADDRRIPAKLE
jgi:ribosomal-protein-alanine N-acetyltransferase